MAEKPRKYVELKNVFWGLVIFGLIFGVGLLLYPWKKPWRYGPSPISGLKQVTLAAIMYSSDSNDCMPPYFSFESSEKYGMFYTVTQAYARNPEVYIDPYDVEIQTIGPGEEGLRGKMSYVHALNLKGVIPRYSDGKRILSSDDVEIPSGTVYLREPIRGFGKYKDGNEMSLQEVLLSPNGGGFVLGFIDGHVKTRRPININTDL